MLEPETKQQIEAALTLFFDALRTIPPHDSRFLSDRHWRKRPRTEAEEDAPVVDGLPIRGRAGVRVSMVNADANADRIGEWIHDALREQSTAAAAPTKNNVPDLKASTAQLVQELAAIEEVDFQVSCSQGAKHFSIEEFRAKRKEQGFDLAMLTYPLVRRISKLLSQAGLDSSASHEFVGWNDVHQAVMADFEMLSERTHYEYEVRVFFNGPILSSHDISVSTKTGEAMVLTRATDEVLDVGWETLDNPDKINAALKYPRRFEIDAGEAEYLGIYQEASERADNVIDALRLLRRNEDVGVQAIVAVPMSIYTPAIRTTYPSRYDPHEVRWSAQRSNYLPPQPRPLSGQDGRDVQELASLIEKNSSVPIRRALNRYRNSFERYGPFDPERVLEYAIALEALYLNDALQSELSYRLSLRLARYLATEGGERRELMRNTLDLYTLRSRIAHTGTMEGSGKQKDRDMLKRVLEQGPELVARSIEKALRSPTYATSKPREFWYTIELDDIAAPESGS